MLDDTTINKNKNVWYALMFLKYGCRLLYLDSWKIAGEHTNTETEEESSDTDSGSDDSKSEDENREEKLEKDDIVEVNNEKEKSEQNSKSPVCLKTNNDSPSSHESAR